VNGLCKESKIDSKKREVSASGGVLVLYAIVFATSGNCVLSGAAAVRAGHELVS